MATKESESKGLPSPPRKYFRGEGDLNEKGGSESDSDDQVEDIGDDVEAALSKAKPKPGTGPGKEAEGGGGAGNADPVLDMNDLSNLSLSSLSNDSAKAKAQLESLEFAFLKPICAEVLKEPSEKALRALEEALNTVGTVPAHLSEFVIFPFAIHLKVIRSHKPSQRLGVFKTLAKLLDKAELSKSYDMFVNIFQKLFVALTVPGKMEVVNTQMSEEEMESIVDCIGHITILSLPHHLDTICKPDKIHIFGHSVFILLQLIGPDIPKNVRVKTLGTLEHIAKLCDGNEIRSKVLYQFLPGIISKTRKICIPSVPQTVKRVAVLSLSLMGRTIRISTEFYEAKDLVKADGMLSQIVELLSKDYILNTDLEYRKSFLKFCRNAITREPQLPNCAQSILKVLLQMKGDSNGEITRDCVEILERLGVAQELNFEAVTSLMSNAATHLKSGDDTACVLALREVSSVLSTRKLSFIEFQAFLPLLFQLMNDVVWKFRNKITVDNSKVTDPVFVASTKICQNLIFCADVDEVVYEFTSVLSELQNNTGKVGSPTGILVTFNLVLSAIISDQPESLSEFEAANVAEVYLSLVDMQSTEVVLNNLSSDIPAVQSAAEIRKAYLLEGLGILGKGYPNTVIPIVLYPLIEHAGLQNSSEAVNESADLALKKISSPVEIDKFLHENLEFIMNEIGVRMLNLILYPNCPSAMVYLAQYFDFSRKSFAGFIDQIFERCSDKYGGGSVQHIYVKVFYALIKSISNHFADVVEGGKLQDKKKEPSLLEKLKDYQRKVGVTHPSVIELGESLADDELKENLSEADFKTESTAENAEEDNKEEEEKLDPVRELVLKISHRVLNFLPNNERSVRLSAMEALICGLPLLKSHENSILPLSHTIWQNLVPRLDEKDYVIVRKSFELLQTLCTCCGTFLKKRTIEEAFPRLSSLLLNLAKEGEQVKNKNRQYYTYTQAYKLQLTVLQGMGPLLDAIDVQEFELDKIVSGCIMYLNPDQHKNLRDAATKLLEMIADGNHCRTVWMKLIACGFKKAPENLPHPCFTPVPESLRKT